MSSAQSFLWSVFVIGDR